MARVVAMVPALFISWKGLLGTLLQETKRRWNRDSPGICTKTQIPASWNDVGPVGETLVEEGEPLWKVVEEGGVH